MEGEGMTLTPEQERQRVGKLTASSVHVLMDGDDEQLLNLWREIVGDPTYQRPDYSGIWPVQLGNATESLNLEWYTQTTGRPLSREGEVVVSRERPWASCTLDAWDEELRAVVEAKHVGGWEPLDRILRRYYPQCIWATYCTEGELAIMSIIEGARLPVLEPIERDVDYLDEMLRRADAFMECVDAMVPPVVLPEVKPPLPAIVEVDMTETEHALDWRKFASTWVETKDTKKLFDDAVKGMKEMVPEDAKRAFGGGVEARRDKRGALRFYPQKEEEVWE